MLSRHTNNVKNEEGVGGKNPPSLRDVIAAQALPLKGRQEEDYKVLSYHCFSKTTITTRHCKNEQPPPANLPSIETSHSR